MPARCKPEGAMVMAPTDAQIAEMRRLAAAATGGPWTAGELRYGEPIVVDSLGHHLTTVHYAGDYSGTADAHFREDADAAYIAAANPQAVLTLLDALQAARGKLRTINCIASPDPNRTFDGVIRDLDMITDIARASPQAAAEEK